MNNRLEKNLLKMKDLVNSLKSDKNHYILEDSDIINKLRQVSCDTKDIVNKKLIKKSLVNNKNIKNKNHLKKIIKKNKKLWDEEFSNLNKFKIDEELLKSKINRNEFKKNKKKNSINKEEIFKELQKNIQKKMIKNKKTESTPFLLENTFSFNPKKHIISNNKDIKTKSFKEMFIKNTEEKNLKLKEYFKKRKSQKILSLNNIL